ncbi:MAG: pectin acetylesterase-family hydrolase [Acidobacteriota bacterium]
MASFHLLRVLVCGLTLALAFAPGTVNAQAQMADIDTVFGPNCSPQPDPMVTAPPSSYGSGARMHRKTVDLSNSPRARCNDGTAGAYYVHHPLQNPDEDRWVIHLGGGFSCDDYHECEERWCAIDPPAPDVNAQTMSSRWLDPTIALDGIFDLSLSMSSFARWNHVLLHYCSSDRWLGDKGNSTTLTSDDGTSSAVIAFRGRRIVRAVVDELLQPGGVVADDGYDMPSLADASIVLWTGTSAGGSGAAHTANEVRDTIVAANPSVDFRLVVDGAYAVSDPLWQTQVEALAMANYAVRDAVWDIASDAACIASQPSGEEWRCTAKEVMTNHIAFPFFVRQDLRDNVAVNFLTAAVPGVTALDVIGATATELDALNLVANASYYGSCSPSNGHVWLLADRFGTDTLVDPTTAGTTTADAALATWIAIPGVLRTYDQPDATTGACP